MVKAARTACAASTITNYFTIQIITKIIYHDVTLLIETLYSAMEMYYPTAVCVILLSTNASHFLSVGRYDAPDDYCFAGGKVEKGETWGQCAVREVREETGLIIQSRHLEFVYADIVDDAFNVITYVCRWHSGTLGTSEPHYLQWVPLEKMCECRKETWQLYHEHCFIVLMRNFFGKVIFSYESYCTLQHSEHTDTQLSITDTETCKKGTAVMRAADPVARQLNREHSKSEEHIGLFCTFRRVMRSMSLGW